MIAPLRRRHRRMTAALLVAVPVLYVLALLARPGEPVMAELPSGLSDRPAADGAVIVERDDLFPDRRILLRLRQGEPPVLELEPAEPLARPDVLVYWTAAKGLRRGDRLAEGAYLLGSLSGSQKRAFALPARAARGEGTIVLYSLGHQEMVAAGELPATGGGGR